MVKFIQISIDCFPCKILTSSDFCIVIYWTLVCLRFRRGFAVFLIVNKASVMRLIELIFDVDFVNLIRLVIFAVTLFLFRIAISLGFRSFFKSSYIRIKVEWLSRLMLFDDKIIELFLILSFRFILANITPSQHFPHINSFCFPMTIIC